MTNKKTAYFLRRYNKWRRGAKTRMPEPKEIGISIDRAIEIIERHDALLFMLRRWMPVINDGTMRNLDGRKVAAALGTAGRPSEMAGGKKVNTYLDAESVAIATKLGNGNVSEGIRKALKQAGQGRPGIP